MFRVYMKDGVYYRRDCSPPYQAFGYADWREFEVTLKRVLEDETELSKITSVAKRRKSDA